jgi:tRNA (guanosine-2'-O-)-methyltransferase
MKEYKDYLHQLRAGEHEVGGIYLKNRDVMRFFAPLLTDERLAKIEAVANQRSLQVIPVVEDIYDRGNISAVMRSTEGMGFGEMHIIQTQNRFKVSARVTRGADKWLSTFTWHDPELCITSLKERGYQILATQLDDSVSVDDVDFSVPSVVVFGNEKEGVSKRITDLADKNIRLPMYGFAQSYNISVAAAMSLYHVRQKVGLGESLIEEHRESLIAQYVLRSVEHPEKVIKGLMKKNDFIEVTDDV